MDKKTFLINGKRLSFSEINFEKNLAYTQLATFIDRFFDDNPNFDVTTSGSTGTPKAIKIEKKYMITSARKTLEFLEIPKGGKLLMCLPIDKIGGIMVLVRWIVGELDLYITEAKSNPLKEWEDSFEFCSMVPFQVNKSFDHLSKIKTLLIGGGAVDPELEKRIAGLNIQAYHSYGMTETLSHIALRKIGDSTVFRALPNVNLSVDSNSCLLINAPDIGVEDLQTKDVVELLGEKEFLWKGRLDNVVNSGGIKFYPEEIEKKLGSLKTAYFFAGVPDEVLGEKLVVLVEGDFIEKINFDKLSKFERPKEVFLVMEFMRTKTGKIKRTKTLEDYLKKIN